ncbi:MAG: branched-chain amino acid ABC transporter permease [Verrucomicrobiota bacterium]
MLYQIIINALITGSLYALVALGFSFTFAPTKFFNLSYGAVVLVAGYAVYTFCVMCGVPLWLGVLSAVLLTGFVGWGLDRAVFYPLRKRNASGMVFLVASLGVFTCIQSLLALGYGSHFRSFSTQTETQSFRILGGIVTPLQLYIFITVIIATILIHVFLKIIKYGKAVKAIANQVETAKVVGIPTDKIFGITFFIGSALAGVAGVLLAMEVGIEPSLGMGFLFKGAIASIIGGMGSLVGAVLGGFLLGLVENLGAWRFEGEWKDAIAFALLIIFLLIKPSGIFGKNSRHF